MKRIILIAIVGLFIFSTPAIASDIVHSGPQQEKLTNTDIAKLTRIFTRKLLRWTTTGDKITVYTRPLNSIEHKEFVNEWLGITNYRYKKLLQQSTFSGSASSVKEVLSDEQMMLIINSTPNSVGYLTDFMVVNDDSKIIIISYD